MSTRPSKLLLGLLALAIATAGCTTTSQGEPGPTSTETTMSTSEPPTSENDDLPSDGAPSVGDPLDTTRYQRDPCQMLTQSQAQDLNLPPEGKPDSDSPVGSFCEWFNTETRGTVEIGFVTENRRGLSGAYRANKTGKYAFFEELPQIDGYPAVAADVVEDRSKGRCNVTVGVSDEVAFDVSLRLSETNVGEKDPCDTAVQVAGMALETMKGGS